MDLTVSWLVSKRVCEVTAPRIVTTEMVKRFDAVMCASLDQADAPVYLIVDLHHVGITASIATWTTTTYLRHRNLGPLLTIGLSRNPIMRHLTRIVAQTVRFEVVQFDTRAAVIAWLETKGIFIEGQTGVS